MHLNQIGKIVAQEWVRSFQIQPGIKLDEWAIMPNHLHGIVVITDTARRTAVRPYPATPFSQNQQYFFFQSTRDRIFHQKRDRLFLDFDCRERSPFYCLL